MTGVTYVDIIIAKDHRTDFRRIMHGIPKILNHLMRIINTRNAQRMIGIFRNAEQNHSTISIGERTVRLPNAMRQTAFRTLCLKTVMLTHARNLALPPLIFILQLQSRLGHHCHRLSTQHRALPAILPSLLEFTVAFRKFTTAFIMTFPKSDGKRKGWCGPLHHGTKHTSLKPTSHES